MSIIISDASIVIPDPPNGPGGFAGSGDEIDVQRRHTLAFIQTAPVVITLVPRARTKMPAGGYTFVNQTPRDPQTMRFCDLSGGQNVPTLLQGSDGVEREVQMILLGRWDAIFEKYDVFTYGGRSFEVASLYPPNGWEQRAQVIRFG